MFKRGFRYFSQGFDFILCPVGGGGLASGTILSTKIFSPKTEVILAEPLNASFDAHRSFLKKKLIPVKTQIQLLMV